MAPSGWERVGWWSLGILLIMAAALLSLEGWIRLEARSTGDRAAARFSGDRVTALIHLVDCDGCDLRERDRAVWALGELRDARALPALKAHYTGRRCDHAADMCQYELGKAIMKLEGTWNLRSSAAFRRSRPQVPGCPTCFTTTPR